MKIGITQKHLKDKNGTYRDILENDYVEYYSNLGITLVPISNTLPNFESFCDKLGIEGFIISGGMGVPATLWGEEIKFSNTFSEKRTETDKKVLDYAIKNRLPVLGVCTGIHYINVYFGGTLWQNIHKERLDAINHVATQHSLKIVDKTAIDYFGCVETKVNSFHNQVIKNIAPKLKSWASCPEDDTIEALYHPELAIAGVTWHPERDSPNKEFNKKLINAFLNKELFWK